jgi:prolyl-tRNA synthetase
MRLSTVFGPNIKRRKDFSDLGSLPTSQLLEELSLLWRPERGGITRFDPLVRIESALESLFECTFADITAQQVEIPVLQHRELWEQSGRWDEFGDDIFTADDETALCPTTEEPLVTLLSLDKNLSYRELPRSVIGTRTLFRRTNSNSYRRPPEFHLLDVYSFHKTTDAVDALVDSRVEPAFKSLFDRLGIETTRVLKREGYFDYKYRTEEGDDKLFQTADGEAYHRPQETEAETESVPCLSLGVTMNLGNRYPADLDVTYTTDRETESHPAVGNYAIGLERLAYAVLDANRTRTNGYHTVDWPTGVHPYEFGIVAVDGDEYPEQFYSELDGPVFLDDTSDSIGTKIARMYALGIRQFAVVGEDERDAETVETEHTGDGERRTELKDAIREQF